MAQISCRVPEALDDAIEEAADEISLFRSDVIRRAVLYYIKMNPDNLDALAGPGVSGGNRTVSPGRTDSMNDQDDAGNGGRSSRRPYDPMDDL